MRKKIQFGKIDWSGRGRKAYAVELEIDLREDKFERPVLSICGSVWNTKHTDIVCGGQCLDDLLPFLKGNKEFKFWHKMWKKYHLNDMKAGTPEQEEAIREWKEAGHRYDYTEACKYLESIGLYEVEYHGCEYNGVYKYGTAWLYQPIDWDDLNAILDRLGLERHN